jgi:hypothetical protein
VGAFSAGGGGGAGCGGGGPFPQTRRVDLTCIPRKDADLLVSIGKFFLGSSLFLTHDNLSLSGPLSILFPTAQGFPALQALPGSRLVHTSGCVNHRANTKPGSAATKLGACCSGASHCGILEFLRQHCLPPSHLLPSLAQQSPLGPLPPLVPLSSISALLSSWFPFPLFSACLLILFTYQVSSLYPPIALVCGFFTLLLPFLSLLCVPRHTSLQAFVISAWLLYLCPALSISFT